MENVFPFIPVDGGVIAQAVIGLSGAAAIFLPEAKPAKVEQGEGA